jgi:hypothetical protein
MIRNRFWKCVRLLVSLPSACAIAAVALSAGTTAVIAQQCCLQTAIVNCKSAVATPCHNACEPCDGTAIYLLDAVDCQRSSSGYKGCKTVYQDCYEVRTCTFDVEDKADCGEHWVGPDPGGAWVAYKRCKTETDGVIRQQYMSAADTDTAVCP